MNITTDLSIKIAEVVVPDEVDLAPIMTEAFIRGGNEKESLFVKQENAGLGAFGLTEGSFLFPLILKGIAIASPYILSILSIDTHYIADINNFLGVCEKLKIEKKDNKLPKNCLESLTLTFETISSELKSTDLPEEKRNEIISKILIELLKEPTISIAFVEKVAASK